MIVHLPLVRGLDWWLADVKEERKRGLVVGLVGASVTEAVDVWNPFGGVKEDLASAFVFGDQDSVQADVVDDHAVRKTFDTECDQVVEAIPSDFEPGGDALAGRDGNLERRFADAEVE